MPPRSAVGDQGQPPEAPGDTSSTHPGVQRGREAGVDTHSPCSVPPTEKQPGPPWAPWASAEASLARDGTLARGQWVCKAGLPADGLPAWEGPTPG